MIETGRVAGFGMRLAPAGFVRRDGAPHRKGHRRVDRARPLPDHVLRAAITLRVEGLTGLFWLAALGDLD
jgi:hypothetical protein